MSMATTLVKRKLGDDYGTAAGCHWCRRGLQLDRRAGRNGSTGEIINEGEAQLRLWLDTHVTH